MASYLVKYQVITGGKPGGNSVATVTASSIMEAKQKFKMGHNPSNYKIIAVVKSGK
jgi:hypothetical protein